MANYELILILKKELNFKKRIEIIREIVKFIIKYHGIIIKIQYLGLQFTYYSKKNIDMNQKGKYSLLQISLNKNNINSLNSMIRENNNIIRHLLIKIN